MGGNAALLDSPFVVSTPFKAALFHNKYVQILPAGKRKTQHLMILFGTDAECSRIWQPCARSPITLFALSCLPPDFGG